MSLALSDGERVWLGELYRRLCQGLPNDEWSMIMELRDRLPRRFDFKNVDTALVWSGQITLLGVQAVDPESPLIKQCERAVICVRDYLTEKQSCREIHAAEVAGRLGLDEADVNRLFRLLGTVGDLWGGNSGAGDLTHQRVQLHPQNLREVLAFTSIEEWLAHAAEEARHRRAFADGVPRGDTSGGASPLRAFISYSHEDRVAAAQVRDVLAEVDVTAFLAHDDMKVSEVWKTRILSELQSCDIFVPVLSKNFLASKWAPQESGFVISRPQVVIAPLSLDGTTPPGFLSDVQSTKVPDLGVTCEVLVVPLATHLPRQIIPRLIRRIGSARTFRTAEARMQPLVPFFGDLTSEEAQALAYLSATNDQIWSANLCRTEYLPELIRAQRPNLEKDTLRALEHQITHDERYVESREAGKSEAVSA